MQIPALLWIGTFAGYFTLISYIRDYFDYDVSLTIFISFSFPYILIDGIYKMIKLLSDFNIYDFIVSLLLLFFGFVGGNIINKACFQVTSISLNMFSIIFACIGFCIGFIKFYGLMKKYDEKHNQPLLGNQENQPLFGNQATQV
jgi:hypothetical protein